MSLSFFSRILLLFVVRPPALQPARCSSCNSCLVLSDDHGSSWQLGGVGQSGSREASAVDVAAGPEGGPQIYVTERNFGPTPGHRMFATSSDDGATVVRCCLLACYVLVLLVSAFSSLITVLPALVLCQRAASPVLHGCVFADRASEHGRSRSRSRSCSRIHRAAVN